MEIGATDPAGLDFNENIVVSKLGKRYGHDAKVLRFGVSEVNRQHFLLSVSLTPPKIC
jgi:hypothetical protein